jgi:chromosome segregation ATPase
MVLYVPLRICVSMFLIPFWLLMGILSAGWLWPPQIREGLFVQKVSVEDTHGELNEIQKRVEEVEKLMNNLNTLKEGFVHETYTDRKDMIRLKNQVRSIKKELKNEMKKIKGVMTSLFEVQQQVMSR